VTGKGRDVTDLVLEFHRSIRDLYPHFVRLGLTVSSDEWQETCGQLLTVLVLAPARGLPAEELGLSPASYALWDALGTASSELVVVPAAGGGLLLSGVIPSTRDPGMVVSFRKARLSDIDGMIRFREFASPIGDERDSVVLDYACGYATARGGGLLRAAVPVTEGRFYLAT
jgi:hypothetical protein